MTIFFGTALLFCVGYWLVVAFYAGRILADSWIWLFFGLLSGLNLLAAWSDQHEWKQAPLWLITSVHTATLALFAVMTAAAVLVLSGLHTEAVENPDYIVVLGSELKPDGTISKTMKKRLDGAIVLSDRYPQAELILSGGQTRPGLLTEAEAMADYLRYNGVSASRMILEPDSRSTYENVRNSCGLIEEFRRAAASESRGRRAGSAPAKRILSAEARPVKLVIVSSDFHLFRAVHMAKKQTGELVYGAAASSDPVLFLHALCRESAALLKDKFLGRL